MLGHHLLAIVLVATLIGSNSIPVPNVEDSITGEKIDNDHGASQWIKDQKPLAQSMKFPEPLLEEVRLRMEGNLQDKLVKFGSNPSPSFSLMGSEFGDKTYLETKQIKHSITDLATQSERVGKSGNKEDSCGATQTDRQIIFNHCPGNLAVITIAGTMKMTCREIERRSFYGPVIIKNEHCQQSFEFSRDCDAVMLSGMSSSRCAKEDKTWIIITQSVIITFLIITMIIAIAWIVKKNKGLKITDGKVPLKRVGWNYQAEVVEHVNEEGKSLITKPSKVSFMNEKPVVKKISLLKFFLLLITCKAITVDSYRIIESYDSTKMKYNYHLELLDKEHIDLGPVSLDRSAVIHSAQITKMFDTFKWSLTHYDAFFCQWYTCDQWAKCTVSPLPFVPMTSGVMGALELESKDASYQSCIRTTGRCAFGWGCHIFGFSINRGEEELFTVYSIGNGGEHGGEISVPAGCVVELINDKSTGLIRDYYLVSGYSGKHYLCHKELFFIRPTIGLLGDVRTYPDGTVQFAHQDIHCQYDQYTTVLCRYSTGFIAQIKEVCHTPEQLGLSVDISGKDNLISWTMSGSALVKVMCDRPLNLKNSKDSCSNMKIKVWEVAHLDSDLLLTFSATSIGSKAQYTFSKQVHLKTRSFKCDGSTYFTTIYDLMSLNTTGLDFSHEVIPAEKISDVQEDHFSDRDPSSYYSGYNWSSLSNWAPTMSSFTIHYHFTATAHEYNVPATACKLALA